jgi:predicted GIY-YIG superfamily endonuclease
MRKTDYEFSSFTKQGGRHTRKEIINSLRLFPVVVGKRTFTQKEYDRWDKRLLCSAQIRMRFGTWGRAVEAAGLVPAWSPARDEKEMIKIFMTLWKEDDEIPNEKRLERRLLDLKVPHTVNLYKKYFGGLRKLAANVKRFRSGEITEDELATRHDVGQDKTYTVYCLHSTRDGIKRYVGETRNTLERRLAQHHSAAIKKADTLYKWMRNEEQDGFEIKIVCLEKGAEYRTAEKKWIAKFLKEGVPLLNGNGKYLPPIRGEKE